MARWLTNFTKEAEEDLDLLDGKIRTRVLGKISWLGANFEQINHLPLGYEWQGFFKLRAGDWRIIYEIDYFKNEIVVHRIEHRSKVYKQPPKSR